MPASDFGRRVLDVVSRIPPGRVATYGDIARLAGRPRAARAVGTIMRTATRRGLPYHRVIAAGGALGGYGGRVAIKAGLLAAEGLVVRRGRVRDFERCRWAPGAGRGRDVQRDPVARRLTG
jgi:O-6-methylguanine DNA methyltransferase